jgi:protein required for attachment to host cells
MILPNDAVVAVVDGKRIRLFRNSGHKPHINLIELPAPDLGTGKAGSGSRHRSSSANPDDRRHVEDDFAAGVADYLNREALADKFGQLLIIADPRTLGELRKHFHEVLAAKLIGQLAKDLSGRPPEAIQAAVVDA